MNYAESGVNDFYLINGVSLEDLKYSIEDWLLTRSGQDTTDFFRSRDQINRELASRF